MLYLITAMHSCLNYCLYYKFYQTKVMVDESKLYLLGSNAFYFVHSPRLEQESIHRITSQHSLHVPRSEG